MSLEKIQLESVGFVHFVSADISPGILTEYYCRRGEMTAQQGLLADALTLSLYRCGNQNRWEAGACSRGVELAPHPRGHGCSHLAAAQSLWHLSILDPLENAGGNWILGPQSLDHSRLQARASPL